MIKKQRVLTYTLLFACILFLNGCHNPNAFDFSRLSGMECEGEWGIPLLNARYTIEDILNMAENPEFLHVGDDGTLEIRYEYEIDSVVSASRYLDSYLNVPLQVSGSETFPSSSITIPNVGEVVLFSDTLPVKFPDQDVVIYSAKVGSGTIDLNVSYNLSFPVRVTAYSPQLTNAAGQMFVINANTSNGEYHETFHLDGYELVTDDNEVQIFLEVRAQVTSATLPSTLSFSYQVSFSEIRFEEIRGKFAPVALPFDQEWDFNLDFLKKYVTGSLTLMNPEVTCEFMNSFPVDGSISLNVAALSGPGVTSSLIAASPANIYLPAATGQFTPVSLPLAPSVMLSADFDHFRLSGDATINPQGMDSPTLVLRADQLIHLRFLVTLPLRLSIDEVVYRDTIPLGNIDIPDEPAFSNLLLRLGLNNGLPLNFQMQAYFYDSVTGTVRDSLFTEPRTVLSAVNGYPRETALFAAKEDIAAVQRMLSCDNIILRAKVHTDGGPVTIKSSQSLGVHLSGRFNMDVNQLVEL